MKFHTRSIRRAGRPRSIRRRGCRLSPRPPCTAENHVLDAPFRPPRVRPHRSASPGPFDGPTAAATPQPGAARSRRPVAAVPTEPVAPPPQLASRRAPAARSSPSPRSSSPSWPGARSSCPASSSGSGASSSRARRSPRSRRSSRSGTPTTRSSSATPAGGRQQSADRRARSRAWSTSLGDPYSAYLTPDEYRQGLQDLSGQFEGIGAEIGTQDAKGETSDCTTLGPDCCLVVVTPIEGSPSEKAGIKAGDAIVAVDGTSLDGLTVDEAREQDPGKKGTEVVPVDRPRRRRRSTSSSRPRRHHQQGGHHQGPRRRQRRLHRGHGFSDDAADEVPRRPPGRLKAGKTKIILDLRGNPGGFVTAARDRAASSSGTARSSGRRTPTATRPRPTRRRGHRDRTRRSRSSCLVDKGSASASEIVAGALQDRKRATLVGETSFGKGTVQQWIQLQDGGALKLTIAKWLTPDKRWIHHVGIIPDVPVDDAGRRRPDAIPPWTRRSSSSTRTRRWPGACGRLPDRSPP